MRSILGILVSLIIAAPYLTQAADADGNYAVWGKGKRSCFSYNKARANDDFAAFSDYTKGFITAYNMMTPETYSITRKLTFTQILEWFDDYCELKQTHSFEQALLEFVAEHYEDRMKRGQKGVSR